MEAVVTKQWLSYIPKSIFHKQFGLRPGLADLLNTLCQRWSKSIDLGEEVVVYHSYGQLSPQCLH